jgi:hypothetical protein
VNLVTYAFPSVGMPTGVIHVGGFDGNEEQWYRQWNAKSVWFEPLPAKCREMQAKGLDWHRAAAPQQKPAVLLTARAERAS